MFTASLTVYLDYCNDPGSTALSDQRRSHGAEEPLDGIAIDGELLRVKLRPASWNVIVTKAQRP